MRSRMTLDTQITMVTHSITSVFHFLQFWKQLIDNLLFMREVSLERGNKNQCQETKKINNNYKIEEKRKRKKKGDSTSVVSM